MTYVATGQYTKRAVIYVDGPPHLNCECGKSVPIYRTLNSRCECGIEYDPRGWITKRPAPEPTPKRERKTLASWHESKLDLSKFLNIGDEVDDEMADYFLGVLPPACYRNDLIQIGEPYNHVGGRPTYSTIYRIAGTYAGPWIYAGHCWRGQTTEPQTAALAQTGRSAPK